MRRPVLAVAAASTLLAVALPSSATEDAVEPVPTAPCEAVEGATTVAGTPVQETVAAPLVPNAATATPNSAADTGLPVPDQSQTTLDFVVDASGGDGTANSPVDATRAAVSFDIGWAEPNGDYDVYVLDADGDVVGSGTSFNPETGAGEQIGPITVGHCAVLTVRVENYAGIPGAEITVEATRGRLRV